MDPRFEPADVVVRRDEGLEITFGDDHRCTFELLTLRLHCPCAGCRGARDAGRVPWPEPSSPRPLRIDDAELVGAWGLGLRWNDGHQAGIYPWEALRRWCDTGEVGFAPNSGLGA